MTVFSTDPIETFSHFFSVLFSAATLNYYVKSKKNQALKEQVDVLSTEVLKETFTPEGVANSGDNRNNFEHRKCEKSTIFERR